MDDRQAIIDEEHLRLLRLGYFVSAGTTGFFALFGLMYVFMGLFFGVMSKAMPNKSGQAPPEIIGWLFALIGLGFTLTFVALALMKLRVARCIRERRSRGFCLVVAAVTCLGIPEGTVLGVMTFLVLGRPSIERLFASVSEAPPN